MLALPARAQTGALSDPVPVDSAVVTGILENGLRYYVRASSEPENRAELRLAVNAGSVLEDDDQLGLAHFVEHMAFNGTRRFERQELVHYLESIGMRFGPDVNAYTSFDETVYMLTVPTDSAGVLATGFDILEDWASGITLDSVEIEQERGVVMEEWRLRQSAANRMHREQFPLLARDSRYAVRDPIGTVESLAGFDHDALKRFYRDWYRPDLMSVIAVGDFDPATVEAMIHERFAHLRPRHDAPPRPDYGIPAHDETIVSVASDAEATSSSLSLYLKRPPAPWTTAAAYRDWMIESLANSMLVNRLTEITHWPGSPFIDVSSFHGRFLRPLSAHVLTVRVPDGGIREGLDALLTETRRVAEHGFTASELEREKSQMLRYTEQRYAERNRVTSGGYAAQYVSNFLYGGVPVSIATEHELYQWLVPEITLAEVNAGAADWMRTGDRVLLARVPANPGQAIPAAAVLEGVMAAVGEVPPAPYVDATSDAPLLPDLPPPGRIVSERTIEGVGITEWELSNGARVLLKPTDFREDEILVAARSPGGTSLLPDSDRVAALTASAVVQLGGLGGLSAVELRKRLAGKMAGVGASIGELHEGLSGAASARDIETLFQLVHLKFTAPRVDSAAFVAYREQARASLENRAASPEAAFADSLRVLLSQHHPRAQAPAPEMFDSLDLHRSLEIYRDRFADASDFAFYIVGTFEPDSIRPLVEAYIATLPAIHREEVGRDLGIRPPEGIVRRTVRGGIEPKALTEIVFTGELTAGRAGLYDLSALAEVLRIRLREVLREDLGGTYGVRIGASGALEPTQRYEVSVAFGSDPERVDELVTALFAELDSLRVNGPTSAEIDKVREIHLRQRETDRRENHFWISQILGYDRYGWDLEGINRYEDRVLDLDAEQLREAARLYLDPTRYVQLSLLPREQF
jgi:zinc protease